MLLLSFNLHYSQLDFRRVNVLDDLVLSFASEFCGTSSRSRYTCPVNSLEERRIRVLRMSPNLISRSLWLAMSITPVISSTLAPRQSCSPGYTLCSPPGATDSNKYDIGDGLLHLYSNILDTVNPPAPVPGVPPQPVDPNGPAKRQFGKTMCCRYTLSWHRDAK